MVGFNAGPLARIEVVKKPKTITTVADEGYNLKLLYDIESPNKSQLDIVKAMESAMVIVAAGDTGVGKTLCVMVELAKWLVDRKVRKVVLTKPEAVAGDIIDPFNDYLVQTLGDDKLTNLLSKGKIRTLTVDQINHTTLKNTLVVMDNAEFATSFELYSVISRLGKGSTLVILGDLHPVLPSKKSTKGFKQLTDAIHNSIEDFTSTELVYVLFNKNEIVRSPLLRNFTTLFN